MNFKAGADRLEGAVATAQAARETEKEAVRESGPDAFKAQQSFHLPLWVSETIDGGNHQLPIPVSG